MKYFPPVQLKTFGDPDGIQTGFGLYATEKIDKNVFIGEYAADLNLAKNSLFMRNDMTFDLIQGIKPSQSLVVGPERFCGYVPLIN